MTTLNATRLRELLTYDPLTGLFRWRVSRNQMKAGDVAGTLKAGYIHIWIDGRSYKAHRLAWLYMTGAWPVATIDHRDLDKTNNRWANLREASRSQNNANRPAFKSNKLGVKGVYRTRTGKYQVQIRVNGEKITLGTTHNLAIAGYVYRVAAAAYFGQFARAE